MSFEWAMIDGVNDRPIDAVELAALARRLRPAAHVNLIPLNPTPGWPTTGSPPRVSASSAASSTTSAWPPPCGATAAPTSTRRAASCRGEVQTDRRLASAPAATAVSAAGASGRTGTG